MHRFWFSLSRFGFPRRLPAAALLLLATVAPGGLLAKSRPAVADTTQVNRLLMRAVRTAEEQNVPLGRQLAAEAKGLAHRTGYLRGELNSIRIMAQLALEGGSFVEALRAYTEGIELAKARKQTCYYEPLYASLGACALEMEQYSYALDMLLTSRRYRRLYPSHSPARDTVYTGALCYANLAKAYLGLGKLPEAMECCRLTLAAGPQAPSYPDVEVLMAELLRLHAMGSRSSAEAALERLGTARTLYHQAGNRHKESLTLLTMAQFLASEGRPFESGKAAEQAAAYAKTLRAVPIQMKALEYQAQAAVAQGDYQRAYALLAEASKKKDKLFNQQKATELEKQKAQFLIERYEGLARVNAANRNLAIARQAKVRTLNYLLVSAGLFMLVGSYLYWRLRKRGTQLHQVYEQLSETNTQLEGALVDISQKVEEKEVLVQEIHHRVKNNLQLVSSLLGWQSSVYPDPALVEALARSQGRIQSMALVHELLYSADNLAEVRLDTYVTKLLDSLNLSFNSDQCPVAITKDLQPLVLTAQQAIPFGLLVNELVTNAYKHAFVGRSKGQMRVELRTGDHEGAGFELVVLDDGVGMRGGQPTAPRASLGTHLVESMARQLKATLDVEPNAPTGTKWVLRRSYDLTATGQRVAVESEESQG
jgi:two-component sensor histidine kinase